MPSPTVRPRLQFVARLLVVLAAMVTVPPPATGQTPAGGGTGIGLIVSSNSGSNPFNGLSINNRVGANAFYAAGYTGTRAVVANVEGGHVWNGHETLTHVTTFLPGGSQSLAATQGVTAAMDRHATWVGHTIAGRATANPPIPGGEYQRGIAPGAALWSGQIASSFGTPPFSLQFGWNTYDEFIRPYHNAMVVGDGVRTADVVNSSWGFSGDSPARSPFTMGLDALVRASNKVVTVSAGNSGPGADTVGGPATGYNVISVGALGSDQSNPTYNSPSGFTSRGPNDAFRPNAAAGSGTSNGTLVNDARVRVDIAAPGQNMTLAYYGGATGGNAGGVPDGAPDFYTFNAQGTSFAAPTVAGGAALMVDAGRALGLANTADGRVVKAVLMTSADKTQGWNNGQVTVGGEVQTTQALDHAVGTGRMNLAAALPFYADPASTRDLPGAAPGAVQARGWDLATVTRTTNNDYSVNGAYPAGSAVTVTLTWFIDRSIDPDSLSFTTLADNALANLDLEVWRVTGGVFTTRVARSFSAFNNSEHLSFAVPEDGEYGIRVAYPDDAWNFGPGSAEAYGLAWNFVPVPEPAGVLTVVGLAAVGWVVRRRATAGRA